jgi:capsular polysaccharide biosynthesis protein
MAADDDAEHETAYDPAPEATYGTAYDEPEAAYDPVYDEPVPAQHARVESRSPHRPGLLSIVLALLIGLAAAAAGYALVSHRQPSYYAGAATLLDQPTAIAASQDSGVVDKLGRLRFKYAGIAHSDTVVDAVASSLSLPPSTVANSIVTRADTDSLLLFIGATAGTSGDAQRIANALAQQLTTYVQEEQTGSRIAPRDQVSLRVVAPARSALQISPTQRQRSTAALGAGIAAIAVVLGIADVLRRRRRG